MLSHLVCCSSSFSLSPRVQYARSALLDENYLLLLLSSSLAGLLQTLFWSVGVCLLKMACFHIRNTYATSQVSIVLDMYIYWWDGIFLSWHHSKGKKKKKNHYLEGFEALLGREEWIFPLYAITKIQTFRNKGKQSTFRKTWSVFTS